MEKVKFRELELEAFVHATESRDAVERALRVVAPGARVEREGLTGHFGQPLVVVRARLRDQAAVEQAVERLAGAVGPQIAGTAERRLDEQGRIHGRLDKQAAALGRIELAGGRENDVIKFTVKLRAPVKPRAAALAAVQERFARGGGKVEEREEE